MKIAIDINDVLRDYTRQFMNYYKKKINPDFDIEYSQITDYNLLNLFPFFDEDGFLDDNLYNQFKFEDYAYEIFARADVMDFSLQSQFTYWMQTTLRNYDTKLPVELMFVSPFEAGLSIQATYSFLARFGARVREVYFPLDSSTIWDRCDMLITANPNLIENVPPGKMVIKIDAPYNAETNAEISFHSMLDVIEDKQDVLRRLIEGFDSSAVVVADEHTDNISEGQPTAQKCEIDTSILG